MKIGLIGLPLSGKTTIFGALTGVGGQYPQHGDKKAEPNVAIVKVGDERVDALTTLYNPKKRVYATIELADFPGSFQGPGNKGLYSNETLGFIRKADALGLVVRNFSNEMDSSPNPLEDVRMVNDELLLSDLIMVENRLERIHAGYQRGQKTQALVSEEKILGKILEHLNANRPIHSMKWENSEEKAMKGFQFLTQKPLMIILNSGEERFGRNDAFVKELMKEYRVIEFAGKFEMELSLLEDREEVRLFMEDIGIHASARDRLSQAARDMLGYLSFFTVGPDEVRAWHLHRGETALEAAHTIHSDLARGFIRAECFTYQERITCSSEKQIREMGRFRLEGRDYVVQDGDILNIRFNV